MKATVAASMRQGNHGPQARSICKKISPQHAQTGKHEYFLKAEIHGRSKPWEFFTDDYLRTFSAPFRYDLNRPHNHRSEGTPLGLRLALAELTGQLPGRSALSCDA